MKQNVKSIDGESIDKLCWEFKNFEKHVQLLEWNQGPQLFTNFQVFLKGIPRMIDIWQEIGLPMM